MEFLLFFHPIFNYWFSAGQKTLNFDPYKKREVISHPSFKLFLRVYFFAALKLLSLSSLKRSFAHIFWKIAFIAMSMSLPSR